MSRNSDTHQNERIDTDQKKNEQKAACETLGCENPPSKRGFCTECIDLSPGLITEQKGETSADHDDESDTDDDDDDATTQEEPATPDTEIDFTAPVSGVWAGELLNREQWMGHIEKRPFSPWADRDHPAADDDEDARWKWGLSENYVDGATIAIAEADPRLDGRVFLQQDDDPFVFVDGDDVRCPESGEVHPDFITILERLGLTYTDISVSGSGSHANYRGELPNGLTQATFAIDDEPWGANDDLPDVEIYAGKHVCVQTGKHVPGTPTTIREWEGDALREILNEHDQLPTQPVITDERDTFDPDDYTPTATTSGETTTDIRDQFAAIDRLDAQRVAGKTIVHEWNDEATTSDGNRAFVPTWGTNANGTANIVDDDIWQDTGGNGYGGPVIMALIDRGDLSENARPRDAAGRLWFRGVEHLRDLGFDIPEYDERSDSEHVALLPNAPIGRMKRGAGTEWNWKAAATDSTGLATDEVRKRTSDAIADAYERGDRVLLDAIMSAGKSYGAIKAAADTNTQLTILTTRGREEQYAQIQDWCDDHGLSSVVLPTITDCETYSGRYEGEHDHAEAQKQAVRRWYENGATGKDIHMHAEEELGEPLVCDGPAGARCTYKIKWEALNPDEYDVLIGHYNHAHVQSVVQGRTLVLDEFPEDTYITEFGPGLASAVTAFLKHHDHVEALPTNYADLMDARSDERRRANALVWFLDQDLDRNGTLAFDQGGHAHAPLAAFTLLASAENDLGNGFERATLPGQYGDHSGDGIGLYDCETGHVKLLTPPDLRYANGIVALDGTPVPEMWDLVLGTNLNHRQVLTDDERAEYITDTQHIDIIRTTEYTKPYSGKRENVYLDEDRALLTEIGDRHGEHADLITTLTAETVYENHVPDDGETAILDAVNEYEHHGNVKGSNKFADSRLGAVIGSRHFGDRYVQQWGAFAGEAVERGDGKGVELEYSGIGANIHQHMTHHETMQAVMRFGRDGKGATVYVHTNTLPDWVPLAGEGRVRRVWSEGMKQVLDAGNDYDEWRTSDLVEHPAVEIGERQIRDHLHTLADRGDVSIEVEGRGFTWHDNGIHRVSEYGEIELPAVEDDDVTDDEVAELGGMELFTWEFRKTLSVSGDPPTSAIDEKRVDGNRGGSSCGSFESGD